MKRLWILIALGLLAVCVVTSCEQNGHPELPLAQRGVENAPLFENLSEKDDVLINLQLAYDAGDQTQAAWLMDQSFAFRFSELDFHSGYTPEKWDRSTELSVLPNMFGSPTPTGIPGVRKQGNSGRTAVAVEEPTWGYIKYYFYQNAWDSVSSMSLMLDYASGDEYWTPLTDPATGETWYEKQADYVLTVTTTGGMQFQNLGGRATFIVRAIPEMGIWRLVHWSDDASLFKDLAEKDHVLHNLKWSYNLRNLLEFNRLIDNEFIFFFSPADFSEGQTPELWGRAAELSATSHMFDPFFPSDPITNIDLNLAYPPGNWSPFVPPGFPGEIWYEKSVVYYFTVQTASGITYIATNTEMNLTVRFTEAGADSIWRLVIWRDETDLEKTAIADRHLRSPNVEEMTWGLLKVLYFN